MARSEGMTVPEFKRFKDKLKKEYPNALKEGVELLAKIQADYGFQDARSSENVENLELHLVHVYAKGGIMRYTLTLEKGPVVFLSSWSKQNKGFNVETRRSYRAKHALKSKLDPDTEVEHGID